jgi:epoxyqueuosine reductase
VQSVVTVAVPHAADAPPFAAEGRYGRVARYAWGRDYHDVILPRLRALADTLVEAGFGTRRKVACDHSPLLERAASARAGLGFVGKNTCLIRPRHGSWWFLAEILLDVPLPATPATADRHCGTCRDCLAACPTLAFPAPFVLDARRCIAYWTIEHRGPLPLDLRARLGAWVFGCDVCQEVCPFNAHAAPPPWPELAPDAGVGPRLDLVEVLGIRDDDAFGRRFRDTALLRPGREGLLRNAAVVARNIGARAAVPALRVAVEADASPVIRAHALWALVGLDPDRGSRDSRRARDADPDPLVKAEAHRLLDGDSPA